MAIRIQRFLHVALTSAAALALAAPAASIRALPQSDGDDTLRGANYVYARPKSRKRAPASRATYRRQSEKLAVADVADARIGVTLWRAEAYDGTARAGTRDIVQVGSGTATWSLVRLGADSRLGTGDMFRIGIESLRGGYLYVVNRALRADGGTGDPYLIFPTQRIRGGENRVVAGRMIMLPTPPEEPPFQMTDPDGTIVGEEIIILVSPTRLNVETRADRYRIDEATLEDWIRRWAVPSETFELVGGSGARYTVAERAAATNGKRLLTRSEPLPQVVHRLAAGAGEPMCVRYVIRVRQQQARR